MIVIHLLVLIFNQKLLICNFASKPLITNLSKIRHIWVFFFINYSVINISYQFLTFFLPELSQSLQVGKRKDRRPVERIK